MATPEVSSLLSRVIESGELCKDLLYRVLWKQSTVGTSGDCKSAADKIHGWLLALMENNGEYAAHLLKDEPVGDITRYVIWSHEHNAWWAPNFCGYTTDFDKAGRYSREDAVNQTLDHIPAGEEVAMRADVALGMLERGLIHGLERR